jgi:hypothetical protein
MLEDNCYLSLEEALNLFSIKEGSSFEIDNLEKGEYFMVIDSISYLSPYPNFVLMKQLGNIAESEGKRLCIAEQKYFTYYCHNFIDYGEKALKNQGYCIFNLIDYEDSFFEKEINILTLEGIEIKEERNNEKVIENNTEMRLFDFRIMGMPPFIYLGRFFNFLTPARLEFMFSYFPVKRAFFSRTFLEKYMRIPLILRKYESVSHCLPLFLN